MSQVQGYFKAVSTLFKGSAVAHIITLCCLPILSRLYSQEQFGELAVVISCSAVLSIILPLRLDLSIYNTQKISEEVYAWVSALIVSSVNLTLSYVILYLFSADIARYLNITVELLYFVPILSYLLVLFNINSNLAISQESFTAVKNAKIIRGVVLNSCQMSLFLFPLGLVIGEVVGRTAGISKLYLAFKHSVLKHYRDTNVKQQLLIHSRFIKFSILGGLANSLSIQLPSIFFASQFGLKVAGLYLLTNRIAAIPIALVGQSMQQVFSSKFKKLTHPKEKLNLINRVIFISLIVSSLLFLAVWVSAPYVIPFILGSQWGRVSEFLILLLPMLVAQLGIFPITNVLNILNKQKFSMIWDLLRLGCLLLIMFCTVEFNLEDGVFLITYSSFMCVFYFILFLIVRKVVANEK